MNIDVKPASGIATMVSEPPDIQSVGIIGAGQMGNGIAHVCAVAGYDVTYEEFDGGHVVTPDHARRAAEWLGARR